MSDAYRKVLIIAYYFPPMGLSGVQRTAKFAKYLPKFGWKPTVLTVAPTGYFAIDESLLKEVEHAGIEIVRTKSIDANRLFKKKGVVKMPPEWARKTLQFLGDTFFVPDTKIGWKPKAVKAAGELLRRERYDLIFATAPPQTDFLIGEALRKTFDLPLVLDYRDSWLDYPFKYFPTPLHKYFNYRLEKRVIKASYRVVTTHRRVKETLLKRYPFLNYNDVAIVSQGYDEEDFAGAGKGRTASPDRMCIAYAGTFYGERSPAVLLRALHNVFKALPKLHGRIELRFVGNMRKQDQKLVRKLGLEHDVTFLGYVEHLDCIKQLAGSDVLWFIMADDFSTPGKLYEYFGTRKPILASIVEGYNKQLILESGAAVCVNPDDITSHEKALVTLFEQFEGKMLPKISQEFSSRFSRLPLAGELAKQFESLMDYDRGVFVKVQEAL